MQRVVTAVVLCAIVLAASGCIAFPRVACVPIVRGRVLSAVDQAPLAGALVTARWTYWSEAVGHGRTHGLAFDYCLTDADGRFAFPGKMFCFMHYAGIVPLMSTELNEVGLSVYTGPLYRTWSDQCSPAGETFLLMDLDQIRRDLVNWPITPVNVAKYYLSCYEGNVQTADRCSRETGGPKHPQYEKLMRFREEMDRKASEWRDRLKEARDTPVLDHPPPP